MPREITHAFGILKKAAAMANNHIKPEKTGRRKAWTPSSAACDEVIARQAERPLPAGGLADRQRHPVQHERQRGHRQPRPTSSGREAAAIPTTTSTCPSPPTTPSPPPCTSPAVIAIEDSLLPAMDGLIETFKRLEKENEGIVKTGRTHLQDATPISLLSGDQRLAQHAGEDPQGSWSCRWAA